MNTVTNTEKDIEIAEEAMTVAKEVTDTGGGMAKVLGPKRVGFGSLSGSFACHMARHPHFGLFRVTVATSTLHFVHPERQHIFHPAHYNPDALPPHTY